MFRILQGASAASLLLTGLNAAEEPATAPWKPQFLTAEQNDTLAAVGERMIPGSGEALCNRLIDSVLPMESEKNKKDLLDALAAFDGEAERRHRQRFRQLTPAQQDEILTFASNDGSALHHQFGLVKEWTADAYWTSLKGLRELGWTGRVMWDSFPNCGNSY